MRVATALALLMAPALPTIAGCGGGMGSAVVGGSGGGAGSAGTGGASGAGGSGAPARLCGNGVCITEFPVYASLSTLHGLAPGPDGDIWFTGEFGLLGHLHTDGSNLTLLYPFGGQENGFHDFYSIVTGPDGNLWFDELATVPSTAALVRTMIRMSPTGAVTQFPTAAGYGAIVVGRDGNLWVAQEASSTPGTASAIVRMSPSGQVTPFPTPDATATIEDLTVGPDGNVWFTLGAGALGRLTPAGAMTLFPLPQHADGVPSPGGICAGPDGNLWFVEWVGNRIGRMGTDGSVMELDVPGSQFLGSDILAGPDGNLWFTQQDSNTLNRITPAGVITKFAIPSADAEPSVLVLGPDGNIWFAESRVLKVARVTFEP